MKRSIPEAVTALTKALVDQGKLVEAGWVGYRAMVLDPAAPQIQIDECRMAFFGGAQHVFGAIMTMLEPGDDPTDNDMRRMDAIDKELREFIEKFKLQFVKTEGSS